MPPTLSFFLQTYGLPITIGFVILIVWSTVWKGLALWKAAKNDNLKWFVVLLVVNTVGILEILYIYVFSKKKEKEEQVAV